MNTMPLKAGIVVLACHLLWACGGGKGTDVNERGLQNNVTADLSNDTCKDAKARTQEQPLQAYVDALSMLADNGIACAQFGLGTLYRTGYEHIAADESLARHYLTLAADQQYRAAERVLEQMR